MKYSEVFIEFLKIAQEKGLLSFDEAAQKAKKTLESNPRADSLSDQDLLKLYNTKPKSPKEMSYEKNVIELAHPKSCVISDSYDKVNALIENQNEQQTISRNI